MNNSWGYKYLKFNRVGENIECISTTVIEKSTIILYEKPIYQKDYDRNLFVPACAKKLGESKLMLPCIFNVKDEDIDKDINHVLGDSINKNRVFKLSRIFDQVDISKKNLYIAIQAITESKSGNCARIILPNGYGFIITLETIPSGNVLNVCTENNMNEIINNKIYLKNCSLLDCYEDDVKTEMILEKAFELIEECDSIIITSEEIEDIFNRLKDYGIRKHLGFTDFKDKMGELRKSIVDFANDNSVDREELEREFEKHIIKESRLN